MSDSPPFTTKDLIDSAFGPASQDSQNAEAIFTAACDESCYAVANIILAIAITEKGLSRHNRASLKALYLALCGDGVEGWRLEARQRKRGRRLSLIEREEITDRDQIISIFAELMTKNGRESAVAWCSDHFGLSRASIFAALDRERRRRESGD